MSNPETVIQNHILLALGKIPYLRAWRQPVGLFYAPDGTPIRVGVEGAADITGIMLPGGTRVEIEVKTPTGRQSPAQKLYQAMIERQGGVYILARSVDDALAQVAAAHAKKEVA